MAYLPIKLFLLQGISMPIIQVWVFLAFTFVMKELPLGLWIADLESKFLDCLAFIMFYQLHVSGVIIQYGDDRRLFSCFSALYWVHIPDNCFREIWSIMPQIYMSISIYYEDSKLQFIFISIWCTYLLSHVISFT